MKIDEDIHLNIILQYCSTRVYAYIQNWLLNRTKMLSKINYNKFYV